MAKVTMFMLCDSVNNNQGPKGMISHLVAPQLVLRPVFIPGNFSFGISIGVQGIDINQVIKLGFTLTAPSGKILQQVDNAELPAIKNKDTLPLEYQGLVLNLDIRNLVIQEEGVHKFELCVNGEHMEKQDIPIFRGVNDGQ